MFFMVLAGVTGNLLAYGSSKVKEIVIPYLVNLRQNINILEDAPTSGTFTQKELDQIYEMVLPSEMQEFLILLMAIPTIVVFLIAVFLRGRYLLHDEALKERFFEFQWNGKWLQDFSKMEITDKWPDVELGLNKVTKEMVVLPGRDRTLNTMIIGSIGTGKTAALALPTINQDLDHMVEYINKFPEMYEREDYKTEKVGGRYLNGLSIIEPSNDLCQKALKLVKAHGIPDEAITYINPLDENTPNLNPMRGPVDKVAETFAQVIAGLNDSDSGNFFFEQAQRNHLKHYIYLLKLHEPDQEVTFDMLLDMYNNSQLVRKMHVKLKETFPESIEDIENRDERNYWKIIQGIDEWFDLNLVPSMVRVGNMMQQERNEKQEVIYVDAKAEHVQGLRNILNDLGANPLIRRVLFGKSNFDFDRHLEVGGILLVNTAKGELVKLAQVLGKIVLMNLQNATFRRAPNVSCFHHILIDEAPDYLYSAFSEFPAQSRKYKVIITTLKQTIAQLAGAFGEHYMTTLIGTMRNRMVYGDVPSYDADYFSKLFGEKVRFEEGQSEMGVSPLQEDPVSRTGHSFSVTKEAALTSGDIMYQDAFECAVKIVSNNKPMPVQQIKANFVPQELFDEAKVQVNQEASQVWLRERERFFVGTKETLEAEVIEIQSIDETEIENEKHYETDAHSKVLNQNELEKALAAKVDPNPRDPVHYQSDVTTEDEYIDLHSVAKAAAQQPEAKKDDRVTEHQEGANQEEPEEIELASFAPKSKQLLVSKVKSLPTTNKEVQVKKDESTSINKQTGIKNNSLSLFTDFEDEDEIATSTEGEYKQTTLTEEHEQFLSEIMNDEIEKR